MKGILYGIGVGPGDPELMTMKAVRLLRENEVVALPGAKAEETVAYEIAVQAVPELSNKTLLSLEMPMIHDRAKMMEYHRQAAAVIGQYLEKGKNVLFLTLGDPVVYSTFAYVQKFVEEAGYEVNIVSGVTSFCAAAASLGISLTEWGEPLHVLPAVHHLNDLPDQPGTYVLMKSGKKMKQVKEVLARSKKEVQMVENCGMPQEKQYRSLDEIPDDAGYYSLIIAKEKKGSPQN